MLLLDNYIIIKEVSASKIATVSYNCDIPSNFITDDHYGLKNVSVLLRGVCFTPFHGYEINFCDEAHSIEFILHEEDEYGHVSKKISERRRAIFIVLEVLVLIIFSLVTIKCWKKLLKKR